MPTSRFRIYHVAWRFPNGRPFYPFPWRSPEGAIYFPPTGRAWIWHAEVTATLEVGGFPKGPIRVLEAWHFVPEDPAERPFAVVAEKYELRRKLKADHNPAEKALKLLLASIYGKLAQSVSAAGKFGAQDGHARKPTYHQIEYAGYVSSVCRAKVYRAAMQLPKAVLAFATDGILSREPLDLPLSGKLGDWGEETFESATIVQSGVYRLKKSDGKWETHGRGFADKNLPWGRIRQGWTRGKRKLDATGRRRFIGLGAAIAMGRLGPLAQLRAHSQGGPAGGRREEGGPAPPSELDSRGQPSDLPPRDRGLRPGHPGGLRSGVNSLEAEMGGPGGGDGGGLGVDGGIHSSRSTNVSYSRKSRVFRNFDSSWGRIGLNANAFLRLIFNSSLLDESPLAELAQSTAAPGMRPVLRGISARRKEDGFNPSSLGAVSHA